MEDPLYCEPLDPDVYEADLAQAMRDRRNAAIVKDFIAGAQYKALAKRHGLSGPGVRNVVHRYAKMRGVVTRDEELEHTYLRHLLRDETTSPPDIWDRNREIIADFRDGAQYVTLARRYDTSASTVRQIVHRHLVRAGLLDDEYQFHQTRLRDILNGR